MLPMRLCHPSMIALALSAGLLVTGDLIAQDPKTPTPAPITEPMKSLPPPQAISKPPVSEPIMIAPEALRKPDLQLTISPRSMSAAPSVFTVENSGPGGATRASLLRVSVRLLPLEAGDLLPEGRDSSRGVVNLGPSIVQWPYGGPGDEGLTNSELTELCPPPFADFEAAIDPLEASGSQAISPSGTRVTGGIREVGLVAARPATRIPSHSYIRQIEVRLVCVYELRATVDANREVQELNERNNEVVHVFQREVTLR